MTRYLFVAMPLLDNNVLKYWKIVHVVRSAVSAGSLYFRCISNNLRAMLT